MGPSEALRDLQLERITVCAWVPARPFNRDSRDPCLVGRVRRLNCRMKININRLFELALRTANEEATKLK